MSSHIDYQRFRRGEACSEEGCRARKFYIEDGKKFCQRGHEQAGFTQTQEDEDDWNAQGKKSRRKQEEKEHVVTVLRGSEARELYLQCYQLILWKQCHWLITVKNFPKELETIVRDIWGLRVGVLQKSRGNESGYGSGTESVMFSSQSEQGDAGSDSTGIKSIGSRRSRRSVSDQEKLPKLVETLSLCYLGTFLLRLPISLGEFYKWATQDEILYTRAIKGVPKEMRSRLPPHFHSALEIRAPLKGSSLYRAVLELVDFYNIHFEMVFPHLNFPLLLYKHIRDLGLPVEIYPAVRRLALLLEIDFTIPILHETRKIHVHPEVQLMSLIVVATKLSQPFDDIQRLPESESDPTAVKIDWKEWRMIMSEKPSVGLKRGEEIKVTDIDVMSMSGKKMDDYLDWFQRTWIDDRDPKIAEQILELFPLEDLPPQLVASSDIEQRVERLREVMKALKLHKPLPISDEEPERTKRPGHFYKRYRRIEDLPENAKAFYDLASLNAGLPVEVLLKRVFDVEVQLENRRLVDMRDAKLAGIDEGMDDIL